MLYRFLLGAALFLSLTLSAYAVTGSGTSTMTPLETVSPLLYSATAVADNGISVTFSEPMLEPGVVSPGNYTVAGLGIGTLLPSPTGVSDGPEEILLNWTVGEMRDGVTLTLTVSGVQDVVGNPIYPDPDSVSLAGKGTVPVFSGLSVEPSTASAGDIIIISFMVSEPLEGAPDVTVNGNPAVESVGATEGYVFEYEVQEDDVLGMATIVLSGTDLAGNLGTFSNNDLLEIVEVTGLPLWGWPWVAPVLLTLGLIFLWRRHPAGSGIWTEWMDGDRNVGCRSPFEGGGVKHRGMYLLLALVLACSFAFAQTPTITNVTVTQSPTATSTQVDIYYDLVAPNGPCDITVSLSKDDGADGYPYPVSSITGDIVGVATGTGKHIIWDIRGDYPEEDISQARIQLIADDGVIQHTLTYLAGESGSISGPTTQTVNEGSDGAQVTAVAETGYHFVDWSDGRTDNPRTDTAVTAPVNVTANFEINLYSLAYTAGEHGSVSGDLSQTVSYGGSGTAVTAEPATGYHFVDWSDGVTDNPRTDFNVIADISATANFAINTYMLVYSAGSNGTIAGDTPQIVTHGSDGAQVTAVPDPHYHFVEWSDGRTDNPRIDTNVTVDLAVEALFAIDTFTLEYLADLGGYIDGVTSQTVEYGQDGTLVTAIPDSGYRFSEWSDGYLLADRMDTFNTQDLTVTAGFIKVWNLNYTAGEHGALEGITDQIVDEGADGAPVTAVPDYGYHFSTWDDGITDNPRVDLNVTGDIAAVALFDINQYTLTYSAGPNGAISGDTPQVVEHGSDGTTVEAVPDYGYHFAQWSDGVTDNPRIDLAVIGNLDVTAEFEINVYTLTYSVSDPELFGLTGQTVQTVTHGSAGEAVGVWVKAPVCYVFDQWSDGNLDNPRQDIAVTGDITVTANFLRGEPMFDDWDYANGFVINENEPTTESQDVILNSAIYEYDDICLEYMASEDELFSDAEWLPYSTALNFRLSTQMYEATVYFKVRNGDDGSAPESDVVSDTIYVDPMVTVPAGTFTMGRPYAWDPAWGSERTNELPAHDVYLDEYQIARHTVTVQEYCDVLNWAYWGKESGNTRLFDNDLDNTPYAGGSLVMAGSLAARYVILDISTNPLIGFSASGSGGDTARVFYPKTRSGYSLAGFPMTYVSWFGAAAYCNWLSRMTIAVDYQGSYYDMGTMYWPPAAIHDSRAYRLPTEAQWERAAAWESAEGGKHWIYGFTSDMAPSGSEWANWLRPDNVYVDPFGLGSALSFSPPGWFDGFNVSPNGSVRTEYAVSPVGCYDMSGNVREWCHDWFAADYYTEPGPWINPTGPTAPSNPTTPQRVVRGGSFNEKPNFCRSAMRTASAHEALLNRGGFRMARESAE